MTKTTGDGKPAQQLREELRALLAEAEARQANGTIEEARRQHHIAKARRAMRRMGWTGLVTAIMVGVGTVLGAALGWMRDHTVSALVLVAATSAGGTALALSPHTGPILGDGDPAPAVTVTAPGPPGPTMTVTAPAPPRVTKTVTAPAQVVPVMPTPTPAGSPTPEPIASPAPSPTPTASEPTRPGRRHGHHPRDRPGR